MSTLYYLEYLPWIKSVPKINCLINNCADLYAYIQFYVFSTTGLDDVIMLSRFSRDQLFGWTHIGHRTLAYSIGQAL